MTCCQKSIPKSKVHPQVYQERRLPLLICKPVDKVSLSRSLLTEINQLLKTLAVVRLLSKSEYSFAVLNCAVTHPFTQLSFVILLTVVLLFSSTPGVVSLSY